MNGLRQRVVQGVLWRAGVSGGEHVLRILFTILLARLLTQADFGLVAMALLVTRFVQSVSQVPFGGAIIRDQEVTDAQISAIFIYQVGVNVVVSVACCAAAPLAAEFFGEPRLTPIVAVLAWSLLLSSLSFPTVLLRKRMEFGAYSALELASGIVGNVLAVIAAFSGLGAWSLVVRLMADRLFFAVAVWWIVRWRPVRPSFRGIGQHVRFGLHLFGSNIFLYVSQNLAAILMGKFVGAGILGCYTIALNLAVVPAAQVYGILATVVFPAFALHQGNRAALERKAYVTMFTLALVYIPFMMGLAAVARPFILVAYGEKWAEAGHFLALLAGVGLAKGLEHVLRCVLMATGRSAAVLGITAIETGTAVLLFSVGLHFWGADGLVAAHVASSCVSLAFMLRAAQAVVGGKAVFLRAIGRSLAAAGLMAVVVFALAAITPWHRGATLAAQIVLGAALYLFVRVRALSDEERALVRTWPVAGAMLPGR